jgi:hypothetical protein
MIKIKPENFCIKIVLFCILQPSFQSAQHLYEKREGSGSVLVTNGSDPDAHPGGPKTYLRILIRNTGENILQRTVR